MGDDDQFGDAYSLKTGEETLAFYRDWAETYDKEIGEDNAYAMPGRCAAALLQHGGDLTGKSILDAGCGTGLSGAALKAAGGDLIDGCDFSPEMLEKAASRGLYRILFQADLNTPLADIADETYDHATAIGVFSFGHVKAEAIQTLLRLIKKDGLLVIGINQPFWDEGTIPAMVDSLITSDDVTLLEKTLGEHLPGHDVSGWVLVLRKN